MNYQLLPDATIDTALIAKYWDDILSFVVTIKLKEATASQLFKRLNAYANQHPLYKALKELGKIIKSPFILRYVSEVDLRQTIEKQLNKGENNSKFSRAVAFGNEAYNCENKRLRHFVLPTFYLLGQLCQSKCSNVLAKVFFKATP